MEEAGGHNPPKMHPCRFCDQVFVTAQALGGHQNCHRHERQLMKKAKEEEERSSVLALSPSKPLPPSPTIPTSYTPNFSNHQNLFRDAPASRFQGPTYAPNRMVPNEYYFQPFAQHHQQILPIPINNCYFGMRNHSNNLSDTLAGTDAPFSRYHMDFPSYYEGMPRQKRPRYEPETYDFFANDGSSSSTTQVVNQLDTIPPAPAAIVGEKAKEGGSSTAGPSTELSMMHNGEPATDNKDGNAQTGTDELDLTLRL